MLDLENSVKKLRSLACPKANLITKTNSEVGIILLVVYVNDIVIIGSDTTDISSLKSFLHGHFHTKDL